MPVNNGIQPKFFRIYDPRETFIFLYNGTAETCNRICKQIYRCSPLWQMYPCIFCIAEGMIKSARARRDREEEGEGNVIVKLMHYIIEMHAFC